MATPQEWTKAYARQAQVDFQSWQALESNEDVHPCHRLFTKHLAAEIEVLNPAVNRNGLRRDNCEYPWLDDTQALHCPLDWPFNPLQLLKGHFGPTFVKLLGASINQALEDQQS